VISLGFRCSLAGSEGRECARNEESFLDIQSRELRKVFLLQGDTFFEVLKQKSSS
jgi:hypothetical protein